MTTTRPWTTQQYIDWKRTRGPASQWLHADCIAADEHIRRVTLSRFEALTSSLDPDLFRFLSLMVRTHYGSAETDAYLSSIGAYPDYI